MNPTTPNETTVMSRTKDRLTDAGVRPSLFGNCSTRIANVIVAMNWPTSFAVLFRPRLRALRILMKSSRKPTMPSDVVSISTSRPDADGVCPDAEADIEFTRCVPR